MSPSYIYQSVLRELQEVRGFLLIMFFTMAQKEGLADSDEVDVIIGILKVTLLNCSMCLESNIILGRLERNP